MEQPGTEPKASEKEHQSAFEIYREASGASDKEAKAIRNVFSSVPRGLTAIESAHEMRRALIAQGFQYNDRVFRLQDILKKKGGNCLGLSLLIGAELLERGFQPSFRLITRPKDAIARKEQELFDRLTTGGILDYDKPKLPEHQADHPIYRFVPLSHPALVLDGITFETTGLDDVEENPEWTPEAEETIEVSFKELSGTVYSELARQTRKTMREEFEKAIELEKKSLNIWPRNLDALLYLWDCAKTIGDEGTAEIAANEYMKTTSEASSTLWGKYCISKNPVFLNRALEQYPSYLYPFIEKNIILESADREARFNFSVAAWCIGNSSVISLKDFYKIHREDLERLFGAEETKRLIKG